MENFERRETNDRRKNPTPGLSRYSFFGRRRALRRQADQERGGYIDRYSPGLFFLLLLIVALNILDAFLTIIILDHGGWEVNPLVRSVIEIYGEKFWAWKFAIVSIALILLCIHSKFKPIKTIIVATSFIYGSVVLYEIFLIIHHLNPNP